MKIHVSAVPPGTHKFQIFEPGTKHGNHPYVLSGLFEPIEDEGCWVTNVQGNMSNEANEMMAITAYKMGFKYLKFYVLKGTKCVTRHADYLESDEHFDYYIVKLQGKSTSDGKVTLD